MQNFQKLKVWQKSHELTLALYRISARFPKEELYGLTSQIRRACASVPTNIAEGCGREGDAEFGRFLQMAMGSVSELEYLILLAKDLEILVLSDFEVIAPQVEEIKAMLLALIKKVKTDKLNT